MQSKIFKISWEGEGELTERKIAIAIMGSYANFDTVDVQVQEIDTIEEIMKMTDKRIEDALCPNDPECPFCEKKIEKLDICGGTMDTAYLIVKINEIIEVLNEQGR